MLHHQPKLLPTFCILMPCAAGMSQGPGQPDLQDQLERFEDLARDRKKQQDKAASEVLDEVNARIDKLDKRAKRKLARRLGHYLTSPYIVRKPKRSAIYAALTRSLGRIGSPAAKMLIDAFEDPRFTAAEYRKEWLSLRSMMLEQLGRGADLRHGREFLIDVATAHHRAPLQAAAGRALRHYEDVELDTRKEIFKDLVRAYGTIHSKANRSIDPRDLALARARRRLRTISDPWNQTLQALSGQRLRTAPQWQDFYNEHKSEDWDQLK